MSKEDDKELNKVCEAIGESRSAFIRSAVLKRLATMGCFQEDRRKILLASK
jgi:hypothetical protein